MGGEFGGEWKHVYVWLNPFTLQFSSVAQPCPTLCDPMDCSTPGFLSITNSQSCSNSCSSSQWCHPTISSSVVPFSSHPQSFPEPKSQFFASGGRSIGASASASVLPVNIQAWFPLGLTGLISLQSKGLSRVFSNRFPLSEPRGWQMSMFPASRVQRCPESSLLCALSTSPQSSDQVPC